MARWSLLTNHGQVLAYVAADPDARLRDVAESVGITERTAAQIVNDLGPAWLGSASVSSALRQASNDANYALKTGN